MKLKYVKLVSVVNFGDTFYISVTSLELIDFFFVWI